MHSFKLAAAALILAAPLAPLAGDDHAENKSDPALFTGADLFNLTVATDPQISPNGRKIAYVRRANDIMTDSAVTSIWLIDIASGVETPLVTGTGAHFSPRWSPDGARLAYISTESGGGP